MLNVTYPQMVAFIVILWVIIRTFVIIKKSEFDIKHEAKLLTVLICFVVISRMVYFPLHHINGHIGVLKFDASRILPFRMNLNPLVCVEERYDGWEVNIIGNITMFIPVGVFWPMCFKKLKNLGLAVLAGGGLSLFIEITQLLFYDRCTDIDDLMLNTIGVLIGAVLYFGIRRIVNSAGRDRSQESK